MSDDKKRPDQNEEQHDNVIRFPVERVKSKRKLKKLAGKLDNNRKTTLFLSLVCVLGMSAFLLNGLDQQYRDVASSDARDISLEKQLAKSLNDPENRTPASYGRRPSSEEFMRRDLQGFHFEHDEGFFYKAEPREGTSGVVLGDLEDGNLQIFLLKYRDYIYPTYDEVRSYEFEGMDKTSKYFELIKDRKPTGFFIQFDHDPNEKVNSIKVQAIRKP